jgi:predicted DNA-binding ribbon-helix-helix protein
MKTAVLRRSIRIRGRKTTVTLENEFWDGLHEIARIEETSVSELLNQINCERDITNLSSAIRLFVYNHFRARMEDQDTESVDTNDHAVTDDN